MLRVVHCGGAKGGRDNEGSEYGAIVADFAFEVSFYNC